jgi:hypothetical protein
MKAATIIAVALATFSSFPSTAQQTTQAPTTQASPAQASPAQQDAQPSQTQPGQTQAQAASASVQLQPISGELVSKLDSKSAKQGDSVILKTSENAKTADGTQIPKGSKLVGHVTNVQARGDGKENSQIAIQFDRAELKGGQSMPIESVIQSISPSASDMPNQNGAMPVGSGSAPATGSMAPGSNPAGGMNQTANNQTANNDRPGLASNTTAQPGATTQDTNANGGAPAPGSIVARNGNVAIRATSIPGVLLANNINGQPFSNASGMLLGARRDIKLDGGTQMVVAVAAAPQGAGGGMTR